MCCLIDQHLEMNGAQAFLAIVDDIVRPGLALDVDDDAACEKCKTTLLLTRTIQPTAERLHVDTYELAG